ncbi:MAG: L,D-transpeptidase [Bdellovibrionaceae bacterium]|nr:L,D-transpeptidase [Pseudobdellovibrionaceae bacterium]
MNTCLKNLLMIAMISASGAMISGCAPAGSSHVEQNEITELNPFDPNIDFILESMDRQYFEQTESNPFEALIKWSFLPECKRIDCKVFALIKKSEQKLYLYVDQQLVNTWFVSTGDASHETPLLDLHPNGRIYDQYSSSKFPGGDYNGLGNMPYAIFLYNGFAIHGTPQGNWKNLGKKASHGCIRSHPDNAMLFNRLVRQYGTKNVWVQITN